MTAKADRLAAQLGSADFNLRAQALAGLVALGREAAEALRPLLDDPDTDRRALAAQALAEIADPEDAAVFSRALRDADGRVRARAAQGLAGIGDPHAIEALILTLNDLPDILHQPATLATHLLAQYGRAGLPQVVPLLKSADEATRRRAWLVTHGIVSGLVGVENWPELWRSLGGYRPDATPEARNAAAERWLGWLAGLDPQLHRS